MAMSDFEMRAGVFHGYQIDTVNGNIILKFTGEDPSGARNRVRIVMSMEDAHSAAVHIERLTEKESVNQ
jgi:hypothetical protein